MSETHTYTHKQIWKHDIKTITTFKNVLDKTGLGEESLGHWWKEVDTSNKRGDEKLYT